MLFSISAGNQDVIYVDKKEILKTSAHLVHESLACLCSIFEPKGHAEELEKTERCYHHGLWNIGICHWNLIVPAQQVDF